MAQREVILRHAIDARATAVALRSTLSDIRQEAGVQRARAVRLRGEARLLREPPPLW